MTLVLSAKIIILLPNENSDDTFNQMILLWNISFILHCFDHSLYAAGWQLAVAGAASGHQAEAAPMVFPLFLCHASSLQPPPIGDDFVWRHD